MAPLCGEQIALRARERAGVEAARVARAAQIKLISRIQIAVGDLTGQGEIQSVAAVELLQSGESQLIVGVATLGLSAQLVRNPCRIVVECDVIQGRAEIEVRNAMIVTTISSQDGGQ